MAVEQLSQVLDETASGITQALVSSKISEEDGIYVCLKAFAKELSDVKTNVAGGMDETSIQNNISETVSKFIVNVTNETSTQAYNAAINVFVSNRLKTIFGYTPLELPLTDTEGDDKKDPDGGEDDNPGGNDPSGGNDHQGSGGSGEMEYGSDDMVWVPGRGYMKYGEVIDEYYSLINQYLHSDELTEEQKNMIRAYYDILFGSKKNN